LKDYFLATNPLSKSSNMAVVHPTLTFEVASFTGLKKFQICYEIQDYREK